MATRSGASSGANVTIVGLKEFRRELRALGKEWPKELRKTHKEIADFAADASQARARGMGGVQAKAAGAIRGKANQRAARIGITPGRSAPMANIAFWGAKRRTGWYGARRYSGGPFQHPPWVGNTWDVAVAGQGPYAINDALAAKKDAIVTAYADGIDRLASKAFPD